MFRKSCVDEVIASFSNTLAFPAAEEEEEAEEGEEEEKKRRRRRRRRRRKKKKNLRHMCGVIKGGAWWLPRHTSHAASPHQGALPAATSLVA
jgi:hypothetical protein